MLEHVPIPDRLTLFYVAFRSLWWKCSQFVKFSSLNLIWTLSTLLFVPLPSSLTPSWDNLLETYTCSRSCCEISRPFYWNNTAAVMWCLCVFVCFWLGLVNIVGSLWCLDAESFNCLTLWFVSKNVMHCVECLSNST